jgi:protein SCO1/2
VNRAKIGGILILACTFAAPVWANVPGTGSGTAAARQLPAELEAVKFEQRMGSQLPLDARFVDEAGLPVRLGQYFGERPVVLSLVYYECPMLCQLTLSGLATSLKPVDFNAGEEFEVVVLSIDEGETPEMAAVAKDVALKRYGREATAAGWHFLTGEAEEIRRVAEAVGFNFRYDPETDQYAHSAGLVLVTPEGKASRYLFGIEYAPRDVRLGLVEASQDRIGSAIDQVLLFCLHYDPSTGKYSTAILNLTRVAGAITVLTLALFVIALLRREKSQPAHGTLGTA